MKSETPLPLAALALALALTCAQAAAADAIHVWTDESGRTHYSNHPGDRPAVRTLAAPPVPTDEESAADRRRADQAREALTRLQTSRQSVVLVDTSAYVACDRALNIVSFLRDYPELPLLRPHDAGEVSLLDDAERHEILRVADADIRQRCQFVQEVDMNELWSGLFWPRTARTAHIIPTQFLPRPVTQEPSAEIRGGRPRTTPATPTTYVVNARRPMAPATPAGGTSGARPATSATGGGGVSFR